MRVQGGLDVLGQAPRVDAGGLLGGVVGEVDVAAPGEARW